MPQLRLTFKTITPLLMYGADNKDDRVNKTMQAIPELRASSLRGILRYWLRAVLGARTQAISELYDHESAILGSTEAGSRVRVRVQRGKMRKEAGLTVLPEQTRGYSLRHTGYQAGGEFRITLSTHPLDTGDVLDADGDLVKALFLLLHFGGLGRRSRRGSGNLLVREAKGYDGDLSLIAPNEDRAALAAYLTKVGHIISPESVGHRPTFPVFAPDTAVVLLGREVHDTYDDAFRELWRVSGPYHNDGGIFGDVRPRRASAIHMRVAQTNAGYVAQQTILYTGHGNWERMRDYIEDCTAQGFDALYGKWGHWQ